MSAGTSLAPLRSQPPFLFRMRAPLPRREARTKQLEALMSLPGHVRPAPAHAGPVLNYLRLKLNSAAFARSRSALTCSRPLSYTISRPIALPT